MIPISLNQLCSITNGMYFHNDTYKKNNLTFNVISIDSKKIIPGCLFIAILGKRFNAHRFINEAIIKGASAILVENKIKTDVPQIIVKDTTIALGKIAFWIRKQSKSHIIALTGSSGKTSVKEITTSILRYCGKTLSTFQNLNNNIGVPLTLLNLTSSHKYAVIEIGANHHKEISYSTQLTEPNIVLINNIHCSHLDGFKSLLGVSKAKQEIFIGLSKTSIAIFNADSHHWSRWKKNINTKRVIWFSIKKKRLICEQHCSK